jgi:membrane fusion protein, multidrug efflux system
MSATLSSPSANLQLTADLEDARPHRMEKRSSPTLAPAAPPPPAAEAPQKPKSKLPKRIILGVVLLAGVAFAGNYGWSWWQDGRFQVETNDAYVRSDTSQVGAKIAGYVATTPVAENTSVKAGDVILTLDGGDYQLAVEAARNKIATQQALIAGFDSQTLAQKAQVDAAKAQLASAQTEENNTSTTQARVAKLVLTKVVSQQTMDDAQARYDQARSAVNVAEANVAAAEAQVSVIASSRMQAETALAELQTMLKRAERDMSFTEVRAPFDGVVANRAVEPGQYVQAGTRLMAIVPTGSAYVEANFKETQLIDIHPGQKAEVVADADTGKIVEGVVESVSPASGSEFSLLPPENATGNFTKITQRYPVRIKLPADAAAQLRPGLSVTATVDSRDAGK